MNRYKARPIYVKLLIAAIVLYVINTTFILSDLYHKVGKIEHILGHTNGNNTCR